MTTEPKWSTTPPEEPGWYWCRVVNGESAGPVLHIPGEGARGPADLLLSSYVEWWPVRIEEPPR